MRRLLALLMIVAFPCAAGGAGGGPADSVPAPEHGFPLPAGARKNESLGGATSVAPGRNYSLSVYEVDSSIETVTAFYQSRLPDAQRTTEAQETRFSTRAGLVRLARVGSGTRITLVIGPR